MREYDREGNEILDIATAGNKYNYDKIILF